MLRPRLRRSKRKTWSRSKTAHLLLARTQKVPPHESRKRQGPSARDWTLMVEFSAAELPSVARTSRTGRLLGLHLRQLHPDSALRPGLARALWGQRANRDWSAHARIHVRAVRIECGTWHSRVRADVCRRCR